MDNQPKNPTASQISSVVNLPGYKIIDVLGKGGMAVVYLAIQESVGRKVALKILAPDHTDETFTDRFLREAQIISSLNHPNIITVYDANVYQGCHYMSMEYVPGNSLREARDKLTRKQKVDVIKQVAGALDFAGKKGYVHRDIKPENILLHEDGRAILTDFGIARSQDVTKGLTITGKVIGTPYYMSPEQTKGVAVDHRSDIYSLGIVLFQSLSGYLPYDGPSFVAIGIKHLSDPIPELPKGLELFQPIINTCLSKDPEHRFQTANELLAALDQINDADLDFIETKLRATSRSTQPRRSKTVVSGEIPPVVSARPRKKTTNQNRMVADAELAPNLDVTKTDDYLRLKRRRRWILLLLIVCLTGLGYYKKNELKDFYQAELSPVIEPYLKNVSSPSPDQEPVASLESTTASPVTDNEPDLMSADGSVNDSDPAQVMAASAQLDGQSAESIMELARDYRQRLQTDTSDEAARSSLNQIGEWYVTQINTAIETGDSTRARLLITEAKASLPEDLLPQQIVVTENHLLRGEAIRNHLQQAEQYIEAGALVVPAGQNAVDSLNAVLSINPDNERARELLQGIVNQYYNRGKQDLAVGKLHEAMSNVELGLTVSSDDPRLLKLRQTVQRESHKQEQIVTLLAEAESRLQAGKAVEPAGENAIESYKSVLKLQSDNRQAKSGVQKVEAYVVKQIDTAIWENKLNVGQRILASALKYYPNSGKLDLAQRKLQKAQSSSAPRITYLLISDHNIGALPAEQLPVIVTPTLYFGFTYTNLSKDTTILNVILESIDESRVLLNKKLIVTEKSGEHIFSLKHPQATFIKGQYRLLIKLGTQELVNRSFAVQATTTLPVTP